MLSNPIDMNNIWNFSTSVQLDISQVSAVIFHILEAM